MGFTRRQALSCFELATSDDGAQSRDEARMCRGVISDKLWTIMGVEEAES